MKRKPSHVESILAQKIRRSSEKEILVPIDCSYVQDTVENWWRINESAMRDDESLKQELIDLLRASLEEKDRDFFSKIAKEGEFISSICLTGLFRTPDPRLGYIMHESLSDLFELNDIKYPYEDHKKLYVKPDGINSREWGNGKGDITPHCDDLYEQTDASLLSLTVTKDETQTPTTFYQTKHIIRDLSDVEVERLSTMKADFISGKNVRGGIKFNSRKVLDYNEDADDVTIAMDFRVDDENGQRMRPRLRSESALLRKIGDNFDKYEHISSVPQTGTFLIVANRKGLHSRDMLQLTEGQIERIKTGDIGQVPRLLYRSKGPRNQTNQEGDGR